MMDLHTDTTPFVNAIVSNDCDTLDTLLSQLPPKVDFEFLDTLIRYTRSMVMKTHPLKLKHYGIIDIMNHHFDIPEFQEEKLQDTYANFRRVYNPLA